MAKYTLPEYNSDMIAATLADKYITVFDQIVEDRKSTRHAVCKDLMTTLLDFKIKYNEIQDQEKKIKEGKEELKNKMEIFVSSICEEL